MAAVALLRGPLGGTGLSRCMFAALCYRKVMMDLLVAVAEGLKRRQLVVGQRAGVPFQERAGLLNSELLEVMRNFISARMSKCGHLAALSLSRRRANQSMPVRHLVTASPRMRMKFGSRRSGRPLSLVARCLATSSESRAIPGGHKTCSGIPVGPNSAWR